MRKTVFGLALVGAALLFAGPAMAATPLACPAPLEISGLIFKRCACPELRPADRANLLRRYPQLDQLCPAATAYRLYPGDENNTSSDGPYTPFTPVVDLPHNDPPGGGPGDPPGGGGGGDPPGGGGGGDPPTDNGGGNPCGGNCGVGLGNGGGNGTGNEGNGNGPGDHGNSPDEHPNNGHGH